MYRLITIILVSLITLSAYIRKNTPTNELPAVYSFIGNAELK